MTVSRFAVVLLSAVISLSAFAQQVPAERVDLQGSVPAPSTEQKVVQVQVPQLTAPAPGPRRTAASDAPKSAVSNGTAVAAGDISSGTFGSLQGGGLFTFPSGIGVNGAPAVATAGLTITGALTSGVDSQIAGTSGYAIALIGGSQGTASSNYGAYLGAANGTLNNIGLAFAANTPGAGPNNWAILSQSQAQSSFAGNLGIGTQTPNARLDLASTVQLSERIRLSGQEYFQPSFTDTHGVSFLLGVNRTSNRQLWLTDSAATALNSTNQALRFTFYLGQPVIDAISTDATTLKNIAIAPWGGKVGIGTLTPANRLNVVSSANGIADGIRVSSSDTGTSGAYVILNKNSGTTTPATLQSGDNTSWSPLALNPSGGNVGVGTSTPVAQFQVTGSGYTTMGVSKRTDNAAISGLIALESSSGTWNMQNASGDLILYSGGAFAANTGAERLRLPATGGIKFPDGTTQTTAFNTSAAVSTAAMTPGTFGGTGTYNFPSNVTAAGSIRGNAHLAFLPWVNIAGAVGTTGYVRLMTPIVANESNMFSLHIFGYRYTPEPQLMDIRCGGYAYTAAGLINTSCTATGTDLPVQITTEPVNNVNMVVVRIGTLTTSWYYGHFSLEYDGWQVKDPAAFTWSVVNALPAGAPALANMNNVAISDTNGGSLKVGQTAGDTTVRMTVNGAVQVNGKLTATQVLGAVYQDVAEWVPATGNLPAGTVVVLNRDKDNEVQASAGAYDTAVAGVVSEMPGLILGVEAPSKAQIATTGRVKVKVDANHHPIKVGDLLVTSDRPGMAMFSDPIEVGGARIHRPGTLIGKALQPLTSGEGEILVLLSLQ